MRGIQSDEALARKREAATNDLQDLQRDGWVWSETTLGLLVNPLNGKVHVRYDPADGELRFSPDLVEMIRDQLREERGW